MTTDIESSPIAFIEGELQLPLYPWQDKAVAPFERAGYGKPIVQVSVLAPNEGGKSSRIVAGSALYWAAVHAKGKVGITTKDSKQLNEQIIPALEGQVHKFQDWTSVKSPYYKIRTDAGGIIIAFVTDDANRVEGLHGAPGAPLLWIVDEAKSVDEPIFNGIDRCGYQGLLYTSTGGLMMGTFWESQYGKMSDSFVKVRAGLKDCPHIAPEKVERIIKKYGELNPFTRSAVYGEFMAQATDDEYCVSLQSLINCLNNPPKHRPGLRAGFCDFGAGVAEHVLAVRNGNKIELAACWIEANKDATAGRFIREFIKSGLTKDQLYCDASDKEIWQKLANAGWPIKRQNFGGPPRLKAEYLSWGAEAWLEAALKIASGEWILPEDDVMKAQAISRRKMFTSTGKLAVEDKLSMSERGIASPDRFDAVAGVMAIAERIAQKEILSVTGWRDHVGERENSEVLDAIGANAGF